MLKFHIFIMVLIIWKYATPLWTCGTTTSFDLEFDVDLELDFFFDADEDFFSVVRDAVMVSILIAIAVTEAICIWDLGQMLL